MAYNNAIPQANQQLSISQGDLLLNFQAIDTFVNVNHEAFNGANQGKHKFLQMPIQGSAPATNTSEMALYTKNVSAVPQMFIRRANNGTEIDITSSGQTADGWARLPSGILVKWGYVIGSGAMNTNQVYSYPVAASIPVFTNLFTVIVGSTTNINNVAQSGTALLTFSSLVGGGNTTITVRAIGTFGATGNAHDWTYFSVGV